MRCLFIDEIQFVLEVDEAVEIILQKSVCEVSGDGLRWVSHANVLFADYNFMTFLKILRLWQSNKCLVVAA